MTHELASHLKNSPGDGTDEGRAVLSFRRLKPWEQNIICMYIENNYNSAALARSMQANRCVVWKTIRRIKIKLQRNYANII